VLDILNAVVTQYAPQETDKLSKSVEAVEISSPAEPEFKLVIETVSFHRSSSCRPGLKRKANLLYRRLFDEVA
jgi:hypothetical protein